MEQGKVISGLFWREEAFKFEGSMLSTLLFKRRRWQKNRIKSLHSFAQHCHSRTVSSPCRFHCIHEGRQCFKTITFSHSLISLQSEVFFIKWKFQFVSTPDLVFFNTLSNPCLSWEKISWQIFVVPLQEHCFSSQMSNQYS